MGRVQQGFLESYHLGPWFTVHATSSRSAHALLVHRKKRIRKSFAKREDVQNVPFLLATQLQSYLTFLQADTATSDRVNEGLQAAFSSIFPIVSHNGMARLEFVSYALGEPVFDVKECQQRGLTYASPLRAKVRLVLLDREVSKPTIKGSQGAGSLHGRNSAHDRHRLVRHQRHRARHRLAAASFAGRVLRARPRQDAQLGQAAVLGPRDSLPRLVAGLRIRSQGRAVLPRGPSPQDAGDDPAEGHRHDARIDPRALLRFRQLRTQERRRHDGIRRRTLEGRDGAL